MDRHLVPLSDGPMTRIEGSDILESLEDLRPSRRTARHLVLSNDEGFSLTIESRRALRDFSSRVDALRAESPATEGASIESPHSLPMDLYWVRGFLLHMILRKNFSLLLMIMGILYLFYRFSRLCNEVYRGETPLTSFELEMKECWTLFLLGWSKPRALPLVHEDCLSPQELVVVSEIVKKLRNGFPLEKAQGVNMPWVGPLVGMVSPSKVDVGKLLIVRVMTHANKLIWRIVPSPPSLRAFGKDEPPLE
ncbi:uncharacterized protein G2W53_004698 [Senna tora]|uniref:Uncharacterized protein n=1 Tax=Senna tora TaxID=362788 RepID=A0A835CJK4_9FABA|nr:uncharacterized protein G2W53_004698 [Senna tora]